MIPQFTNIATVIANISTGVFAVSSALVGLMIIVCGIYLMIDRNTSFAGRLERLGFLKNVLMGYAVIFGGNFLVQLLKAALLSGGVGPGH
jgi:hypothetical protein